MPSSSLRLPSYRHMHRLRYHPYGVTDREARRIAFDPVAFIMPVRRTHFLPCSRRREADCDAQPMIIDMLYPFPAPPGGSFESHEDIPPSVFDVRHLTFAYGMVRKR